MIIFFVTQSTKHTNITKPLLIVIDLEHLSQFTFISKAMKYSSPVYYMMTYTWSARYF